jgi:hypothetical protein
MVHCGERDRSVLYWTERGKIRKDGNHTVLIPESQLSWKKESSPKRQLKWNRGGIFLAIDYIAECCNTEKPLSIFYL